MTRKIIIIAACTAVIVAFGILLVNRFSEYRIEDRYSFSEVGIGCIELTETEKNNITSFLEKKYAENDSDAGFKTVAGDSDLYYANSVIALSEMCSDEKLTQKLLPKLDMIEYISPENLDILNLTYYVNICKTAEIPYNQENIIKCLEKFYDSESGLFYLNDSNDTINIKLVITALCCRIMPEIIGNEKFDIVNGVKKSYENYEFGTDKSITLYNSGGDILYCMSVLGLIDEDIISRHMDWFRNWEKYIGDIEVNSFESALYYVEFYKIALIFDSNYSAHKIQSFYENVTAEEISGISDFTVISNAFEYVKDRNNDDVNTYLHEAMEAVADGEELYDLKFDIRETAYGVILAKLVDFEVNSDKLRNYINETYDSIENIDVLQDKVNYLYYTVILDEQNNNYRITCDVNWLQGIIDDCIGELKFKDNIAGDIVMARKLLEIVVDLQVHEYKVKLSNAQAKKLISGLKKAVNSTEILDTVLITDIYTIDLLLHTDCLSKEAFVEKYENLTADGGSKAVAEADCVPDIVSTRSFFVCFDRMGNLEKLDSMQNYVTSLMVNDGIYENSSGSGYISIESVLFGNDINKFIPGGEK